MRQVLRLLRVRAASPLRPQRASELDGYEMLQGMAGYILEPLAAPPPGMIRVWGYLVALTSTLGEPGVGMAVPMRPSFAGAYEETRQLRPVGRRMSVAATEPGPNAPPAIHSLRPVRSGQAYRITSASTRGLVTPVLAEALETVFERFARERGFTREKPLEIQLARGFKANSHGHKEGRAADIEAAGSKTLLDWKQEWDRAIIAAEKLPDPQQRAEAIAAEQQRNLGYGLYKALQAHGGWRVNQGGWRVYRGVMQLFGPWTATEGPWKVMQIKEANLYQRQRQADQQWVFRAHQDHIHVAR